MSASPLPALGGGVRASVVRLASGRIFYVGDMYLSIYRKLTPEMAPKGFSGDGAYAALSDDDGRTWRIRKLTGGNVLDKDGKPVKVQTVSYVTACQSPDGMIHLVTSHNGPDLHFELNEAWVLQDSKEQDETVSRFSMEMKPGTVKQCREDYPNGRPRVAWSAGIGEDGHYLIDGTETWYYQNGKKQWQAEYRTGQRTGAETYWSGDGKKQWQKVYGDDGDYVWTLYDADGNVKAQSTWRGKILSSHKIHR
jgi:hypothetical protein